MTLMTLMALMLFFQPPEMMVLECTADTYVPGLHGVEEVLRLSPDNTVLISFRMGAVEGWKIQKAVMLLHQTDGSRKGEFRVAPITGKWNERTQAPPELGEFQAAQTQPKADQWLALTIPPEVLANGSNGIAIRGDGQSIHSRESLQFSPYLAVQRKK